jgi:hypothetical protein
MILKDRLSMERIVDSIQCLCIQVFYMAIAMHVSVHVSPRVLDVVMVAPAEARTIAITDAT